MLLLLTAAVVVALVWAVTARARVNAEVPMGAALAQSRSSLAPDAQLLGEDVLVFVHRMTFWRDDGYRILDQSGNALGLITVGWKRDVCDSNGDEVIRMYQQSARHFDFFAADGRLMGSIVCANRSRTRFILQKSPSQIVGRIVWQRVKDRDVAWAAVVTEPAGRPIAEIVYPRNRAAAQRLRGDHAAVPSGWRGRMSALASPNAYILRITAGCTERLRFLAFATAAHLEFIDFHKEFSD